MPKPLPDLSPLEYEHPFDTQAMDAVSRTPGLDTLVRQFNKLAVEKFILIQHTGSSIKLGASQLPDIHALLEHPEQAGEILQHPRQLPSLDGHARRRTRRLDRVRGLRRRVPPRDDIARGCCPRRRADFLPLLRLSHGGRRSLLPALWDGDFVKKWDARACIPPFF